MKGKTQVTVEEPEPKRVERCKETINQPDLETTYKLKADPHLHRLDVNVSIITEQEINAATSNMKSNKAAVLDEITVELVKSGEQFGNLNLTTLLNTCWTENVVLEERRLRIFAKILRILLRIFAKKGNLTKTNGV